MEVGELPTVTEIYNSAVSILNADILRANLTADLPAQTGLRRQERACGHENCTQRKPIRAACETFNMSKIKSAQTKLYN